MKPKWYKEMHVPDSGGAESFCSQDESAARVCHIPVQERKYMPNPEFPEKTTAAFFSSPCFMQEFDPLMDA